MRLNKINFIAMLFTLFFSVVAQTVANSSEPYIDKNNPANDLQIEVAILSELLKERHYKKRGFDEFRQRCLDYFGVDIRLLQEDYQHFIDGTSLTGK